MKRAFTIIELLLALGIIGLIAGIGLPFYFSFYERSSLESATRIVAHSCRRAEAYARALRGDSAWGVRVSPEQATLFKGNDFASRDADWDEIASWPVSLSVSGADEIVFSPATGQPLAPANLVLESANGEASSTIAISAKGLVTY